MTLFTIRHSPFTIERVSFYPTKISEKFYSARNVGAAIDANAGGTGATFGCGAALRITLRIDDETKEILDAKFKTGGCGYLIAAAETLAEKIIGRKLNELHRLDQQTLEFEIENEIGKFSAHRKHCLKLAAETLRNAFADFRQSQIEEWKGEQALICTCFGVAEETIENLIVGNSLESIEEVTELCNAGGGCGSCQPLIQEIIDTTTRGI